MSEDFICQIVFKYKSVHQFYLSQFFGSFSLDASHNDQIDTSAKETVLSVLMSTMSNMSMSISSPVPPSNPGWPDNQRNGSHRCNGSGRQGNLRGNYVQSRIFKRQKNILGSDFSMWVISFLSIAIFEHWSHWRLTSYRASCVWHHVTLPRHSVRSVRENNGHLCLKHMNFGKIL